MGQYLRCFSASVRAVVRYAYRKLLLPVEQEIGQFYKNKDASCGNTVCRLVFVV